MSFNDIEHLLLLEINVENLDSTGLTRIIDDTDDWHRTFDKHTKSKTPIERVMEIILISVNHMLCREILNCGCVPFIIFHNQMKIGNYFADFEVEFFDKDKKQKYIIECDGHNFHEKTKEQAKYDKQRERVFVKEGYKVLRFSGSEIYNNFEDIKQELYNIFEEDYCGEEK